MLKSNILALSVLFLASSCGTANYPDKPRYERLDHIAVWAADWKKSAQFLEEYMGWDLHPIIFGASGESVGDMDLVFVDGNGLWIEFVQPTSEGPGMELLDLLGDGAVVELDFQSDNYQQSLDSAIDNGLQMLGMDGLPLKDRGRIIDGIIDKNAIGEMPDEYIAYFPYELTGGTAVEIYERNDEDGESILNKRDAMWGRSRTDQPYNESLPKIKYLTLLVEDINTVRKFYEEHLLLDVGDVSDWQGHKSVVVNANGVYEGDLLIRLIQPIVDDSIMRSYQTKGSGHVLEIAAEVKSIQDFNKNMIFKGVKMVDSEGREYSIDSPFSVDHESQESYFYFPLDLSLGMNIKVFEKK